MLWSNIGQAEGTEMAWEGFSREVIFEETRVKRGIKLDEYGGVPGGGREYGGSTHQL